MKLNKSLMGCFVLLLFSLGIVACGGGDPDKKSSSSNGCYIEETDNYSIGVNPNNGFIRNNVIISGSITATNCSNYSVGPYPNAIAKYVTRNGNTVTVAKTSNISGMTYQLMDFEVSGLSVVPKTINYCYMGYQNSESITSGTLNTVANKITLNIHAESAYTGCSTSLPSMIYEHTELKGLWEQACTGTERKLVNFYRNSAIYMTKYYSSSGCSGVRMYIEQNGPYNIRSTVAGGKELDMSFQNVLINLFDSTLATNFNSVSMCGISTWSTGVDINVSGRTCDFASVGMGASRTFSNDQLYYDLYQKSGTTLYLGDSATGDGQSSATRPTSVLSSGPFYFNSGFIYIPDWVN